MILVVGSMLAGCDRVGSEAWSEKPSQKPKGDRSASEAADYARNRLTARSG